MISYSDFEKAWFLYKTEYEPKNVSINEFCVSKGIPYRDFNTWFRKTHKQVDPLEVDGMETVDELKGYVRFLFATVQEKDQEISHLKNDLSEIKNELKAANRRADEEAETRRKLFERFERFMDNQKSSDEERRRLLRKVETLENRLSLANQALYGGSKTCNEKYSDKKSEGINDGRDDFDGTMQSLPEGTPGPAGKAEEPEAGRTAQKKSEQEGWHRHLLL